MADYTNAQAVPEKVREMAETNLAKARQAVEQYMSQASKFYQNADASAQALQDSAREGGRKAADYAQANIKAAFDFAEQLVKAKDAQEFTSIQQAYVKAQAEQMQSQMKELGATAANAARAVTPKV